MDNVVTLRGEPVQSQNEPNARVIEVLEKLLADARDGRLRAVAGALETSLNAGYFFAGSMSPLPMIGALEMVKTILMDSAIEEDE